MFSAKIDINEKDYLKCNRYYLKKYLGIREYILVALLICGGLFLYLAFDQWLILLLCGIAVLLMAIAVLVYLVVARKSFREEFTKRNTYIWEIRFLEDEFEVTTLEENGEKPYTEKRPYATIDKVAVLKDRVYIFAGPATMYYIKYDAMTEGNFIEFCEFVKKKIEPSKFKMKDSRKKHRQYPY